MATFRCIRSLFKLKLNFVLHLRENLFENCYSRQLNIQKLDAELKEST